jgi:hypothetical protein
MSGISRTPFLARLNTEYLKPPPAGLCETRARRRWKLLRLILLPEQAA